MSDLEELGFIASPHTSAGRVPTPRRLPLLRRHAAGDQAARSRATCTQLEDQLHPDNPQRVIQAASQLLSQLTQFAGVVMTPRARGHLQAHRVPQAVGEAHPADRRHARTATCRTASCSPSATTRASELVEAANFINQNYAGQSFEDVRARLHGELREIRQDMIQLMTAALDAGSRRSPRAASST